MKDPRKEVYEALEASGNESLVADLKDYTSKLIGKDEAIADADKVRTDLEAEQNKNKELQGELTKLKEQAPAEPNQAMQEKLDALQKAFEAEQESKKEIIAEKATTELTAKLDGSLKNVPEAVRSAIVTAMQTKGYKVGGKTFKAVNGEKGMQIVVDNVDNDYDTGLESLFNSGVSEIATDKDGGGLPNFDDNPQDQVKSFDDDINADL